MWVVVHATSGLALGAALHAPLWLLLPLALVLHVVLDLVPHWDYTRVRYRNLAAVADVLASFVIFVAGYLAFGFSGAMILAGAVSAVPDLDVLNSLLPYEQRIRWFPSHWSRFPHGTAGPALGIAIQAAILAASALIIAFTA